MVLGSFISSVGGFHYSLLLVFMKHTRKVSEDRAAKWKYFIKERGLQMPIWNPAKYYD